MKDTWASRDLPVLEAAVSLVDEIMDLPEGSDIAERCGLSVQEVAASLRALDGEYVDLQTTMGDPSSWFVRGVTAAARRAVGQWPTPERLVDRLAAAFAAAADAEPDAEKKGRLRQVAGFLGTTGRDLATNIVASVIAKSTGIG